MIRPWLAPLGSFPSCAAIAASALRLLGGLASTAWAGIGLAFVYEWLVPGPAWIRTLPLAVRAMAACGIGAGGGLVVAMMITVTIREAVRR